MTEQQVRRILRGYPADRKPPSVWQTVSGLEVRPGWSYGWAVTFFDVWDRQITRFDPEEARAVAWEHREAARYARADRKGAFTVAPRLAPVKQEQSSAA